MCDGPHRPQASECRSARCGPWSSPIPVSPARRQQLRALEDAIDVDRRAPIIIVDVISIGQQAAQFSDGGERPAM
jgi:hypothetical protein